MNIPGFTAQNSLQTSSAKYSGTSSNTSFESGNRIFPQMRQNETWVTTCTRDGGCKVLYCYEDTDLQQSVCEVQSSARRNKLRWVAPLSPLIS